MITFAGVGSRTLPDEPRKLIKDILWWMDDVLKDRSQNVVIRTGAAPGTDQHFLQECNWFRFHKEIFLPWSTFERGNYVVDSQTTIFSSPSQKAYEYAEEFHPAWHNCKSGAKALHARNTHQILGPNVQVKDKVNFVLAYTEDGKMKGGTAQALRLAQHFDIPIYNVGDPDFNLDGLQNIFISLLDGRQW